MNKSHIEITLDPSRIIPRVHEFFSASDFAEELLQNARRSEATKVTVTIGADTLVVEDDGRGIDDPTVLTTIGHSDWSPSVMDHEGPVGMGIFSVLAAYQSCVIRSRDWELTITKSNTAELVTGLACCSGTVITARQLTSDWPQTERLFAEAAKYKPFPVIISMDEESAHVHGNFQTDQTADWKIRTRFGAISLFRRENITHTHGRQLTLVVQGRGYDIAGSCDIGTVPELGVVIEVQPGIIDLVLPRRDKYIDNSKSQLLLQEAGQCLWEFYKAHALVDGPDAELMLSALLHVNPQRFRKEIPEILFPKLWKYLDINHKSPVPLYNGELQFTIDSGLDSEQSFSTGEHATQDWFSSRGWTAPCENKWSVDLAAINRRRHLTGQKFALAFPELVWGAEIKVEQDPRGKCLYVAKEIILTNEAGESKPAPLGDFSITAHHEYDVVVVHTFPDQEVPFPSFEYSDFFEEEEKDENLAYYQDVFNTHSSCPAPDLEGPFLNWAEEKFLSGEKFPLNISVKIIGEYNGYFLNAKSVLLDFKGQNRHRTVRLTQGEKSRDLEVVTDSGWSEFPKR